MALCVGMRTQREGLPRLATRDWGTWEWEFQEERRELVMVQFLEPIFVHLPSDEHRNAFLSMLKVNDNLAPHNYVK